MVLVVDYGICNVRSVVKALDLVGANVMASSDHADIRKADRIVLPGVGAFGDGMGNLTRLGLVQALTEEVVHGGKPFLGICLGMQLLARESEEFGFHVGLGWVPAVVRKVSAGDTLRVPHMGWNEISIRMEGPLFRNVRSTPHFYFVHSYRLVVEDPTIVAATCEYGDTIVAAILKDNVFATQFHPEKSQDDGLVLLENFVNWRV